MIESTSKTAWKYHVEYGGDDNNFALMFIGCSHIDSVHCNRDALRRVLDRAVSENARIIFNGDNNDLMQGRWDKRREPGAVRADYRSAYVNDIVDDTVKFLEPYAGHIDVFGLGNHETSFMRNNDVDVTSLIANELGRISGRKIYRGGLQGYVAIRFQHRAGGDRHGSVIHFRHDGGALGKRSKGILAYDILAGEHPNSDVFVVAHSHNMLHHETQCEVLTTAGKIDYRKRMYLQCPSFKEEWKDADKLGWWTATNKGARAVGGWLLRYTVAKKGADAEAIFVR